MYAFGPIPQQKRSGRVIGTHQKIDRVARRQLSTHLVKNCPFPGIDDILHFEGSRGPDGIKMKSPGRDEPWHFIDPKNIKKDDILLTAINDHIINLTTALKKDDMLRASFEAAWLAHAVTDGLTPAHHEPLAEQLKDLRTTGERRHNFSSRIVMTGNGSRKQFIANNWSYWGAKGVMTTHTLFEAGVATTIKPLRFTEQMVSIEDIARLKEKGFIGIYIEMVESIDRLEMYETFKQKGWTRELARQTTKQLIPMIIQAVTLAWYEAYTTAEQHRG